MSVFVKSSRNLPSPICYWATPPKGAAVSQPECGFKALL